VSPPISLPLLEIIRARAEMSAQRLLCHGRRLWWPRVCSKGGAVRQESRPGRGDSSIGRDLCQCRVSKGLYYYVDWHGRLIWYRCVPKSEFLFHFVAASTWLASNPR
jgi:hypothetical protein